MGPNMGAKINIAAKKRLNTRPKSVVTTSPTQAQQPEGVGTKYGPYGPSQDLQDPQKGHFGPKRALLRPLGAKKRPNTRPKCVVTMIPTQSHQPAGIWTKSGPCRPSEDLQNAPKVAFWAKTGPFGTPGGHVEAQYEAKVCGNHNSNPVRPIGDNRDQIWPQ